MYRRNRTTRLHLSRNIATTLLTILFALGLATGTLARGYDGIQSATWLLQSAGDGELVVTITQVDSQAFPQVMAHFTVSDAGGWLLGDLTAADFQVFEDDTQVSTASITVERDETQTISIILALDVSMPSETLTRIQEEVKSFIGVLGPRDGAAIVTFSNEVQVVQSFTTRKDELGAAIDALEPGGTLTALNEAVFEAATMAGTLPPDRKMVVVLTDSKDNSGTLSTTDAVSRAIESGAPVYIVGFGSKVESDVLTDMAERTGGQARIFSDPDGVRTSLQALEGLPQPGYQITFQSGLEADNAEHDLSIGVAYVDGEGQSTVRFVAVPGELTVTLPDITDGQTVGDIVSLVADVTAPASIASVEYLLDGKLLTKQYAPAAAAGAPTAATSASYSFDWDSTTVEPGAYTLTVGAIDSAGNAGYAQAHINVVLPVAVSVSAPRQEIELGDEVAVEAQVDALADVVEVEFLLDGQSVDVLNTPPYRFPFNSNDYLAGEHVVTVRAKDSLGRENSASLSMQFLAPPEPAPPQREWLRYVRVAFTVIVTIVAVVVGIIVAVWALGAASRWQRKRYRTVCYLEIQNLGNVRNQYQLLAEDPAGALMFQFVLNGVNLGQPQVTQVAEMAAEAPKRGRRELTRAKRVDQAATAGSFAEKARRAKGAGQAIIGVLSAVGSILPYSVGAPLRSWTSRLRQQQAAAGRLERAPRQVGSQLQQVHRQASRSKPSAPPTRATPSLPSPQTTDHQAIPVAHTVADAWVQTPFVEPGETLVVDVLIDPIERPRQTRHYPIVVTSRSVEREDAPRPADAPLVVEEGNIRIVSISWFYRLLPFLIFVAVIAIEVLLIWFLLRGTGVLG